jgi:hypothetical protein
MLRSLLIALLAALLVGAAVTNKAEAQGWTCTWGGSYGWSGWSIVSGWGNIGSTTITSSYVSNRTRLGAQLSTPGATLTAASITYTTSIGFAIASRPSFSGGGTGTATQTWSGTNTSGDIYLEFYSGSGDNGSYTLSEVTASGTGTQPSSCPGPTPTPVPPTNTPTNTPIPPTATNTPLPTSTGVPYPTPGAFAPAAGDSYWGNTYNMAYGLQGWSLQSGTLGGGRVVSASVGGVQRIDLEYPLSNVKLTDVFVNYEATCAHTFEVKDGSAVFEAGSVGSGMQALVWQGEHVVLNGKVGISLIGGSGCGVSAFQLTEITLMGYGVNPTNLQATAIAIRAGDLYSGLSDVNELLGSLPGSLNSGVPDETGRTLFGYAKWLISPSSADELAGPFAPIVSHTGIFLTLVFGLTLVYAIVWAAVWIFRFIVWIFRIILQIIQVVVGVVGSILKFIF